jgi:hypothetical protein
MFSIKAFGKLLVEPKTLGWEHSRKSFRKYFQKPWSNVNSTEMFSKMVFGQMELIMKEGGVGGFIKRHWCFFVVARNN